MSISFNRSMRSLQNDSFFPPAAALVILVLVLTAWLAWFTLARISQYETSSQFEVNRDGSLQVSVSALAARNIMPGQPAFAEIKGFPESMTGTVMDTDPKAKNGQIKIYLETFDKVKPGASGQIRIEVESVSPAQLLMRSLGIR